MLKGVDLNSEEVKKLAEGIGNGENKFSFDLIEMYTEEGLFDRVDKRDFPDFDTLKREGKDSKPDNGDAGTGNERKRDIGKSTGTLKGVPSFVENNGTVTNKSGDVVAVDSTHNTADRKGH